ncbi:MULTISPECIES: GNAT family N-acetyltransferase [Streptomyces]|uniref:GNAT family N-acetyltransferase n=1 Tax=Streptomyces evansiae TaxID=3075535 RepID=A0ABU2R3U6_9ACTN|nr:MULTISPECIES: GNAT family N-acetyltransferase [unclassified Streptomyces]MDT0410926.1 GNAT family N-acetyltransferase [Streptomyces sp. DSM 41979]MYQ59799.1 GNAT family N-acetyltransferase [Streptomyces sp. SID4926]SCE11003.1 Ribosomal protein S18 acetylase RimI [Streptomyces sp. DfronAA-171]
MQDHERGPTPGAEDAVTLRAAGEEDLDTADALFTRYLEFYEVRPADPARSRAFLAERLSRRDSFITLASTPTRGTVGLAQVYPGISSLDMAPSWLLSDLFVVPRARGLGIGRALLRSVLAQAREADVAAVQLETAYGNHLAQKLYESEGFRRDPFHVYLHQLR